MDHHVPLRWALAGFGSGGRIFHAPLLSTAERLELAAIVTTDPQRRRVAAGLYPKARCVASLDDLPPLGIAGVTLSTPPATHLPLALRALELGLHVVVDKPVGLTSAEVARLREASVTADRVTIPYHNRRWDGDFRTVQELVASGALGSLTGVESRLDRSRTVKPGWSSSIQHGGGLLLDLGPHLIDQMVQLLGPVESVVARVETVRAGASADDVFSVTLHHQSGIGSAVSASLAAPAAGPRFLVQGTRAGVRIEGFDGQEALLKDGQTPVTAGESWGVDRDRLAVITDTTGHVTLQHLRHGAWQSFYPAVSRTVTDGARPPVTMEDALHTAAILDAARESADAQRHVAVRPTG